MKTTTIAAIPMAMTMNRRRNNTNKKQVLKEHALWNAGQQKQPGFFDETSISCLHVGVYQKRVLTVMLVWHQLSVLFQKEFDVYFLTISFPYSFLQMTSSIVFKM